MRTIKKGATSQSIYVVILDSTSTTGGRKTGLLFNTAGITAYYALNGGSATAITLATLAAANSAWATGGFKEVDATNMPGVYRLDVPNAALTGADSVVITIKGATGAVQVDVEIQLTGVDLQDATAMGVSRIDAAVSSRMATFSLPTNFSSLAITAGGAVTAGTVSDKTGYSLTQAFPTNFSAQVIDASGRVDVSKVAGTAQTARDLGGQLDAAISTRLAASAIPTNFGTMAITVGGAVTVGTNGDKTGYALTAAYDPAKTAAQAGDAMNLSAAGLTGAKAQVVAALSTDTYAEPGQGTPAATATIATKLSYLYKLAVNLKTQTSGQFSLYNSAGSVVDQKSAVSDDGTTMTRAAAVSGP